MANQKKRTSVLLPKPYKNGLDQLIEVGIYLDRQAAIRDAIRILLIKHKIPPFYLEPEAEDRE